VLEVADVFRRFADDYLTVHDIAKRGPMPASHRRAIADIMACRTEALGGHLWRCNKCSAEVYSYHSCKNRSCPKCHTDQTERWLEARKLEMLSCGYFHVTITVPKELRLMLRANQRDGYALLMKAQRIFTQSQRPQNAIPDELFTAEKRQFHDRLTRLRLPYPGVVSNYAAGGTLPLVARYWR
jgi:hypothetical protein